MRRFRWGRREASFRCPDVVARAKRGWLTRSIEPPSAEMRRLELRPRYRPRAELMRPGTATVRDRSKSNCLERGPPVSSAGSRGGMADPISAGGAPDVLGVAPTSADAAHAASTESALASPSARWLLLATLFATVVVQSASLDAFFFEDDYLHLFGLANGPTSRALFTTDGGHVMLAYKALLLVLYRAFGFESGPYFAFVVVLHLVNVFLLFDVLRRLTSSPMVGAVGASLWGVLPLNGGALGWITAFGQVMATTAILWLLRDVARLAEQKRKPDALAFVRWGALMLVAATSYGLGMVVGATVALFVWLLLPAESARLRTALLLSPLVILLPMLHRILLSLGKGSVIVVSDLSDTITVFLGMMSYGTMSVLLGPVLTADRRSRAIDVLGSASGVEGLGLAYALAGITFVVLGGLFYRATPTQRRQMLAFLLLACAAYGTLALGRAWIVGRLDARFELVTEPRYAYFPTLALSGLLALGLGTLPARRLSARPWIGFSIFCAWLAIVVVPARITAANLVNERSVTARMQAEEALSVVRAEASASPSAAEAYITNDPFAGASLSRAFGAQALFPGLAALWVVANPTDSVGGRRLRFVEHDHALVEKIRAERPGTRIVQLLVHPDEVPAGIVPRTVVLKHSGNPALERVMRERAERDPEFRRRLAIAVEQRAQRAPAAPAVPGGGQEKARSGAGAAVTPPR